MLGRTCVPAGGDRWLDKFAVQVPSSTQLRSSSCEQVPYIIKRTGAPMGILHPCGRPLQKRRRDRGKLLSPPAC
eukprot:13866849-Alexandrium_andersonii.AAC.1